MFNTFKHDETLGAFFRYSVPKDCEVRMSTLADRLQMSGLSDHTPSNRAKSDALRCAFSHIMSKSTRQNADGGTTSLIIAKLPRRTGADDQRWAVHEQTSDRDNQVVGYQEMGYAALYDDGGMIIPSVLTDVCNVYSLVEHYMTHADHTKIRECVRSIVRSMAKPLPLNGISFIAADRIDYLKERVKPLFGNLDTGHVTFTMYEVSNTPGNAESLKADVTESVADEISKIQAAIIKAKDENSLQKSAVADWLKTIDILKSNMAAVGALGIHIPADLTDVEKQVSELMDEVKKPKSKRLLFSMH